MRRLALFLLLLLCGANAAYAADVPAWARELAASNAQADGAPAVVLLDQVEYVVTADGKLRARRRYAMRLNDRAGREAAAVREVYVTSSGEVKGIRGWLVRAQGAVRELGARDAIDVALVDNDLYNDVRVRVLTAAGEVQPGDLFAAEVEREERLLFAQVDWDLQGRWPVRMARRSLTLPPGWRHRSVVFNAAPFEPRREKDALVWEMSDLPALRREGARPSATDVAARVAVSFFGPDSARAPGQFESWEEVSAWLNMLSDAPARPDGSLVAKARQLGASAASALDRVAAIARYVQQVRYVSIQTGIGRGGGYQPRAAPVVFERSYGDCKDKVALMRAMLAAIEIRSYAVAVFSGDRSYVRPEWPSPQQFNHVIVGISLPDASTPASSVIEDPDFGPLLLFDPTDPYTPFGELPLHEQGGQALVVAPSSGRLVSTPATPAGHHMVDRSLQGVLGADGTFAATIRERFTGSAAADARARYAVLDSASYRAATEGRISRGLPRAHVRSVMSEEDSPAGFRQVVEVHATAHAQVQGDLLIVALPFDAGVRPQLEALSELPARIGLEPSLVREVVRLQIPAEFALDEQPAAVSLQTPFGSYSLDYAVEGGHLVARRSLETPLQTLGPEQYVAARAFFDALRAADSVPAVLKRRR